MGRTTPLKVHIKSLVLCYILVKTTTPAGKGSIVLLEPSKVPQRTKKF